MNKTVFSLSFILLLGGFSHAQAAEEIPPANLQTIETLQRRAEKLNFGELAGADSYHLAKARAWLNMATSEFHEGDGSGALIDAIGQAETLLDALENKQTDISMDTPLKVRGSEAVRPDLLDKITELKKHGKFSCGQRQTAEAEVYLVWAGHEFYESGKSHSESYLRSIDNLIYEAQVAMDNCAPSSTPAPAPSVVQSPILETSSLSGDALFAFNKATLNPDALWRLNNLADHIKQVAQLEEVILTGHTDHLRSDGRQDLNRILSEKRAESIKQYLVGKGIPEDKITTKGAGSALPLVQCQSGLSKVEMIACLQPNRRVEIILRGAKNVNPAQPPALSDNADKSPSK